MTAITEAEHAGAVSSLPSKCGLRMNEILLLKRTDHGPAGTKPHSAQVDGVLDAAKPCVRLSSNRAPQRPVSGLVVRDESVDLFSDHDDGMRDRQCLRGSSPTPAPHAH